MLKKKKILTILGILVALFCLFLLFPKPNQIETKLTNKTTEEFQNLINKNEYQVFVFDSSAYFPFNFARHPWFVLNKKGEVSRWEVRQERNKETGSHLYFNSQLPFQGLNLTYFIENYFWKVELLGFIEGDENSVAQKMIDFMEKSKETYPYTFEYSLTGPNSNTYLQWVLNKFPEFNIKLSWRFIGKDFKINK